MKIVDLRKTQVKCVHFGTRNDINIIILARDYIIKICITLSYASLSMILMPKIQHFIQYNKRGLHQYISASISLIYLEY